MSNIEQRGVSKLNTASERSSRRSSVGRGALFVLLAMALFVAGFVLREHRNGLNLTMLLFIGIPAAVMFLFLAPAKFGADDRPPFQVGHRSDDADTRPEHADSEPQEPHHVDESAASKWRR